MKQIFWSGLFSLMLSGSAWAQTPPTLTTFVPAPYPASAQSAGVEASVLLQLTVEADGSVSDVQLLTPAGFGFDEAAIEAAKKFIFSPATQNNTPMRAVIQYRYHFLLQSRDKKANPNLAPLDMNDPEILQEIVFSDNLEVYASMIQGLVVERGTRTAISEAQVFLLDARGAVVQEQLLVDGSFAFVAVAPGAYTIKVIAPGFESLSTPEKIEADESIALTLRLMPSVDDGYGVVVRAASDEDAVTRRVLAKDELVMMPGTQGDALRALQNLPGVARPPAGGGLLVVRGSSPQNTQVFINGMPVPFLFHITGLTSVITTSMIESIDFQPGVYSAKYGRGLGGVIEVKTSLDVPDSTQATWDVGLLDLSGAVKTNVNGMGLSFAARRSDVDVLMPLVLPETAQDFTVVPRYWDYQAGLNGKALGGKWQVMAFGARDTFTLSFEDPSAGEIFVTSTQQFHRLQGYWEKKLDSILSRSVAASVGVTNINEAAPPITSLDQTSLLAGARIDWATRFTPTLGLRYGGDFRLFSYEIQRIEPAEDFSTLQSDITATNPDAALYTEAVWQPIEELLITPGVRVDYFAGSDTLTLDPRAQATWKAFEKTTLNAGAGIFHEDPRPQELNPTFGDPGLHPLIAKQISVGASRLFWDNKLQGDVSFYYKKLDELVTGVGVGNTNEEAFSNQSRGRVKGAEFLLKYPPRERFFGWLAYSLSKAERQRLGEDDYVPFFYDQRHVLTMLGSYKLTNSINIGGRFRYASGSPQTPIVVSVYDSDNNVYLPVRGERNSTNLPDFHQLDLRIDKTFRFKSWKMSAYLEVLNIYNRKNAETTLYNFDYTQSQFLNGLPIIPALGLRGEL
jgi:TonB family protein